jgi:ABC-2 type transport system ATP-binding protein
MAAIVPLVAAPCVCAYTQPPPVRFVPAVDTDPVVQTDPVVRADPVIRANSLSKRYGPVTALGQCDLAIERAEVFGLLGPNGSGKTTLLRLLMGFLRPTAGSATVEGFDCYRDSVEVHRRVAYMPAEAKLFRQMRGRDVLRFFADVRPSGDFDRALMMAERLSLELTRQVAYYSTGMRQKLALAAVLACDTPIVILDEPTANLDPTVRGEVTKMIIEAREAGRTVILSSHVLSEVEQCCDRVVILRRGDLVHTQEMSHLRRQHRISAELTGPIDPLPPALVDQGASIESSNGQTLRFAGVAGDATGPPASDRTGQSASRIRSVSHRAGPMNTVSQ